MDYSMQNIDLWENIFLDPLETARYYCEDAGDDLMEDEEDANG